MTERLTMKRSKYILFFMLSAFIMVSGCQTTPVKQPVPSVTEKIPETPKEVIKSRGLEYKPEPFLESVKKGDTELVSLFLDAGMNPDARDGSKNTALIIASREGHVKIVKALVFKRADVTAKNSRGRNALMLAGENGHAGIVEFLLVQGADLHNRDNWGITALMKAASSGDSDIVKTLIKWGADVNERDGEGGTTVLMHAIMISLKFYLTAGPISMLRE
jgi:ankyrin repeat protein